MKNRWLSVEFVMWIAIAALSAASDGCASRVPDPRDPALAELLVDIDPQRIRTTVETLASFKTRHTLSDPANETAGIGAARRWIESQFKNYAAAGDGRLQVEMQEVRINQPSERVPAPVTLVNVIATLPSVSGPAKDRVYIVSGHYDSRNLDPMDAVNAAPGANDDASGVAAVMEIARVLSRSKFDATIVFVCFAGEEQGLLGSAAFAEKAKAEGWNIVGVLNNDIIGNTRGGNRVSDDRRVRVFSEGVPSTESAMQLQARQSNGGENDGASRQLARFIKEIGELYVPGFNVSLVYRRDRFGRGGDHIPFLRQGFPAVRLTEPNEDFSRQHQNVTSRFARPYGDVPEFVDYEYIASVARVNAAVLANLAAAPASPQGVTMSGEPAYDTAIRWQRDPNLELAGYAILVRETSSPTWQRRIDVGKVNVFTLHGYNKDDWMFGVEAYDIMGHRSLPSIPIARRAPAASRPAAAGRPGTQP
ncbi:M20/M25/M40 family metallo-hydrolase [soil metagenome]